MATPKTIGRITINTLDGSDTIAASRFIINDNFEALANSINAFQTYVNTEEKEISGIESLSVTKGTSPISDVLISTNGSISAAGNLAVNLGITANSAKIKNNVEIDNGNVILTNTESILSCAGRLSLGGELVLKDFGNQYVIAAHKQTFTTNNWSNLVTDSGNNIIGGSVSLKGTNSIIFDFSSYVSSIDSRYFIDSIKLNTEGISVGQRVLIVVLMGSVTGHTFKIMPTTLCASQTLSTGVEFNASYQSIEIIFDGTNWLVINYTPGVVLS